MKKYILLALLFSCQKEMCDQPDMRHDPTIIGHCTGKESNGQLHFIVDKTVGHPPYQYSIDAGKTWSDGWQSPRTNDYSFTGLKAGNYFMVIKSKIDGCMSNTYDVTVESR